MSIFRLRWPTNWQSTSTTVTLDKFDTLGPQGWKRFASIGSNGWTLYIAPEPLDSAKLLEHTNWKGFYRTSPSASGSDGGTSGRFEVAQVVARVFPAHRDHAHSMIKEGFDPTSDYPFGPFSPDQPHLQREGTRRIHNACPATWTRHNVLAPAFHQPITGLPCSASALTSTGNSHSRQ